jgi:L-amino acid N-acyltransferase YncA
VSDVSADELVIRHADPARDAAGCAGIYAPYVRSSPISFEEQPPTPREMTRRIEQACRTHPWLVAERGGQLVGFAYATQHRARAAYRWACDVTVYVDVAHHRRGIGRRLYEPLLELLRRQRFHIACAGITLPNNASIALHEALGFRPVGVYREIGYKAGAWRDVGWWQLRLHPAQGAPPEPLAPQGLATGP